MKERPILFSAPMVRALIDNRKTQTRRVVKHPLLQHLSFIVDCGDGWWGDEEGDVQVRCPYGMPGDRLWVRETFAVFGDDERYVVHYKATNQNEGSGWKPSIHMRREYSRILLEVVSVRVERLQNINDEDAKAEGLALSRHGWASTQYERVHYEDPKQAFEDLWKAINGAVSWDQNPWVWVVEFKRLPHA